MGSQLGPEGHRTTPDRTASHTKGVIVRAATASRARRLVLVATASRERGLGILPVSFAVARRPFLSWPRDAVRGKVPEPYGQDGQLQTCRNGSPLPRTTSRLSAL